MFLEIWPTFNSWVVVIENKSLVLTELYNKETLPKQLGCLD